MTVMSFIRVFSQCLSFNPVYLKKKKKSMGKFIKVSFFFFMACLWATLANKSFSSVKGFSPVFVLILNSSWLNYFILCL